MFICIESTAGSTFVLFTADSLKLSAIAAPSSDILADILRPHRECRGGTNRKEGEEGDQYTRFKPYLTYITTANVRFLRGKKKKKKKLGFQKMEIHFKSKQVYRCAAEIIGIKECTKVRKNVLKTARQEPYSSWI